MISGIFLKKVIKKIGLRILMITCAFGCILPGCKQNHSEGAKLDEIPNVIIIYVDDMGYGDLGCFGNDDIETPRIDRMAAEGIKFTNFYNSASGCTPSRAALLTGRYHMRNNVNFIPPPHSPKGMDTREVTIAEVLKASGYTTAAFGKWHLGTQQQHLPKAQGFDYFYGTPSAHTYHLPLSYNPEDDLKAPIFESTLTTGTRKIDSIPTRDRMKKLTDKVVAFLQKCKKDKASKPFFIYIPYPMPHTPIAVPDELLGKAKSKRGLYADVMLDVDQNVGRILDSLKSYELEKTTLVIFASDNGPATVFGNHAGSAHPLRGAKSTEFDGGVRSPCIMYWPQTIAPNQVCADPVATVDILPTLVNLIPAARMPPEMVGDDRVIDGRDIRSLFLQGTKSDYDADHRVIPFYEIGERSLHAVRIGKWKMIYPHSNHIIAEPGMDGKYGKYGMEDYPKALYDMRADPGESTDVQHKYPEVVKMIDRLADSVRQDLGDKLKGIEPSNRVGLPVESEE